MADYSFLCLDCKVDTNAINEYYTLENEVWLEANPADRGMLCIGCVENRLGRSLRRQDFMMDAPINLGYFDQSERLLDRINTL